MSGDIYIIGDSHIGLSDGDETPMLKWLDRLASRLPKALYLNGDVFHYLIGDPKFFTQSAVNFCRKLKELKDSGIAIHYVEGNRDFFLEGSPVEPAVTELALESSFTAGSKKFLIVHGDMINDHDLPYRFWRKASKNPITRLGVRFFPKGAARRFVDSVERRLSQSNFKHKRRLPVELMEAYGKKRKAAQGYDVVVFGHFHQKTIVDAGESKVIVVPAWYESGEALRVDASTGDWTFEAI